MDDSVPLNEKSMPGLLIIGCVAACIVGLLQLVAIGFPRISPTIDGERLTHPLSQLVMGLGLLLFAWGIFSRRRWARSVLIILPILQYAVFYVDTHRAISEISASHILLTVVWIAFFAFYCYR
ncbi:MAG: hypothetical protein KJ060_21115, partial [Candidatus Hydrogenedentes bacterium]|nr:hypothetical protein [Candidatus Hydrogenedentota bacterium]